MVVFISFPFLSLPFPSFLYILCEMFNYSAVDRLLVHGAPATLVHGAVESDRSRKHIYDTVSSKKKKKVI